MCVCACACVCVRNSESFEKGEGFNIAINVLFVLLSKYLYIYIAPSFEGKMASGAFGTMSRPRSCNCLAPLFLPFRHNRSCTSA